MSVLSTHAQPASIPGVIRLRDQTCLVQVHIFNPNIGLFLQLMSL